jgi:hypothetical protein
MRESMTDERMAPFEVLAKKSDSDFLRETIGHVAQRRIQMDVMGLIGAG